ncbi:MAG TPA: 23S rRNA (adenine(2503)-C(2))-methyltransferase RlmN, partial [Eubacteriaceae bacterium]|nr:23S rRNA (adenine(2503)-C(2))-methyltransferase RlmN [Eubacteriaceae bacterium]
ASAIGGCLRNLSAGEMVEQIIQIENKENLRIRNIVLMGSGEPFDNYQQVIRFLEVVTDPQGLDKGKRHISISTSGIVPKIYDFAEYDNQYHLSISLHSPFQKVREKLMPIGKKHSLEELMKACLYYEQKTNRKITFEYAMIKDVNDDAQSARELANILKPFSLAMVNLIAVNEVKEKNYYKSNEKTIEHFRSILRKNGVHVTVRRKLGSSINAACGQLRRGERQS